MKIVILGNGIAGITAARHLRKRSDCAITVISDESDHFFSRTALMYIYMGHMRLRDTQPYEDWFWQKNRIDLLRARIERVDFAAKKLFSSKGEAISYDKLLIATGSRSNKFGWPGQDLDGVHGLYHLQDLEAMERQTPGLERAVVVGGGLIGVEMAEMFHSRGIAVTFLVREVEFWNGVLPPEESRMVSRHLREHHIDLRLETELKEILPDDSGKHCAAAVTTRGEKIDCGFVGLTVGVSPNIDFLKNSGLDTNRGILVDEYLCSSDPDVFAAGDCAELRQPMPGRRAIEAVWYTGRMMGETAAHNLLCHPESAPISADQPNPRLPESTPTHVTRPNLHHPESAQIGANPANPRLPESTPTHPDAHHPESAQIGANPPNPRLPESTPTHPDAHHPESAQIGANPPNPRLPYNPGIWFNSAKFFDIEYQVYGDIRASLPDNQATLYWEHPGGKKSIRLNYEKSGGRIVGFNLMGVRYRHEVCEKWLRDGAHIEQVLQQLGMANFDPEFYPQHEQELITLYNRRENKTLKINQKRGLEAALKFLRWKTA